MNAQSLVGGAVAGAVTAIVATLLARPVSTDAAAATEHREQRLARLEQQLLTTHEARDALSGTLEEALVRLEQVEARAARPMRAPLAASAAPAEADAPARTDEATGAADGSALRPDAFRALMGKVLRSSVHGTATEEEQERFWRAARETGIVDETIDSLEQAVELSPGQAGTRMQLADAYVAKLLTVPAGPERGLWGMKAEAQWQAVVDNDPEHWEAQYTLAFNHSMYPDFLNKTDDAIRGFERALEIQRRQAPTERHAQTYVQLARMHRKKGDMDKAREVLESGRMRHPRDKDITQALAALPGR